jgi:hypothetical protein
VTRATAENNSRLRSPGRLAVASRPDRWFGVCGLLRVGGGPGVGFCIEEQDLAELREEHGEALLDELKVAADPARFPLSSKALPAILKTNTEKRFVLGLRLMLAGV